MTGVIETPKKPQRFEVLDSWRGICACMIVFFHFNDEVFSHFLTFPLTKNAYIFVDFFFVLSGFVIAANYQDKLLNGMRMRDYMTLRLGRIYPLHIVMLLLLVAFECTKFVVDTKTLPFSNPAQGLEAFIANIFLVQSVGLLDDLSWNAPAWSISVEFYTYLLYALALVALRKKLWMLCLLVAVAMPFVFITLGKYRMDITHDFGLLRCIYGFSVGVLAHKAFGFLNFSKFKFFTIVEVALLALLAAFITFFANNEVSFWAPYLFFACIVVFAQERGFISRLLKWRPFLFVGMLSYSIYMVHTFVQLILYNIAKIGERVFGFTFFRSNPDGRDYDQIYLGAWGGDLVQMGGLLAVIVFGTLTYYFIEKPANDWTRGYVRRKSAENRPLEAANP